MLHKYVVRYFFVFLMILDIHIGLMSSVLSWVGKVLLRVVSSALCLREGQVAWG